MPARSKVSLVQPIETKWEYISPQDYIRYGLDFKEWCARAKKVRDKSGKLVPFILNEAQIEFADTILPLLLNKERKSIVEVWVHKSRQLGISTVISALEQYVFITTNALTGIHMFPTNKLALAFAEEKFTPLLEATHPLYMPTTYARQSLNFVDYKVTDYRNSKRDITIQLTGANNKGAGRSGTNQLIIFDEYAYYTKVAEMERGVLATQGSGATFGIRVYVSTAHGTNHFFDGTERAKKFMQTDQNVVYLFLPWHILKEYEAEPKGRLVSLTHLRDYEIKICEEFDRREYPVNTWTRKLQWYEDTLEKDAKGDINYMHENYPTIPEESFAVTGDPVLPANKILEMRSNLDKSKILYLTDITLQENIEEGVVYNSVRKPSRVMSMTNEKTFIEMYHKPVAGKKYILGVDPAFGGEESDYSAGVVLDYENLQECASFRVNVEQDELAEIVVSLGRFYNTAMVVPENNMGGILIEWLRINNYPRLHLKVRSGKLEPGSNTIEYGVRMTRQVKGDAIEKAKYLINKGIYISNDEYFIKESLHFMWQALPSGLKKAAAVGTDDNNEPYHDDTIMARLVAFSILDLRRYNGQDRY